MTPEQYAAVFGVKNKQLFDQFRASRAMMNSSCIEEREAGKMLLSIAMSNFRQYQQDFSKSFEER